MSWTFYCNGTPNKKTKCCWDCGYLTAYHTMESCTNEEVLDGGWTQHGKAMGCQFWKPMTTIEELKTEYDALPFLKWLFTLNPTKIGWLDSIVHREAVIDVIEGIIVTKKHLKVTKTFEESKLYWACDECGNGLYFIKNDHLTKTSVSSTVFVKCNSCGKDNIKKLTKEELKTKAN